jgi:hypothetical protein
MHNYTSYENNESFLYIYIYKDELRQSHDERAEFPDEHFLDLNFPEAKSLAPTQNIGTKDAQQQSIDIQFINQTTESMQINIPDSGQGPCW